MTKARTPRPIPTNPSQPTINIQLIMLQLSHPTVFAPKPHPGSPHLQPVSVQAATICVLMSSAGARPVRLMCGILPTSVLVLKPRPMSGRSFRGRRLASEQAGPGTLRCSCPFLYRRLRVEYPFRWQPTPRISRPCRKRTCESLATLTAFARYCLDADSTMLLRRRIWTNGHSARSAARRTAHPTVHS